MSSISSRKWQYLSDIIMATAFPVVAYLVMRSILSRLDIGGGSERDKEKADAAAKRLDKLIASRNRSEADSDSDDSSSTRSRGKPARLVLSQYEQIIAADVVLPEDIPVTFEDIGGLDSIIEELRESVIYPLTMPHLYSGASNLLSAPSGVLLYGPPGCGKTMLAKALARESGATFINLHISTLTEKWFGDSNKLVHAVFSLARKLEPSIVFIDEIDALLGTRRSGEHEASGMVKAEFMTHWDGLASVSSSGKPQRICILGATNRINDIDAAILRRMPKKFPVSLPDSSQRRNLFNLILKNTKVDWDHFDLDLLVHLSDGMSGSDIKEKCREAAIMPVRESIRALNKAAGGSAKLSKRSVLPDNVRGVRTTDFGVPANLTLGLLQAAAAAAATESRKFGSTVGSGAIPRAPGPESGVAPASSAEAKARFSLGKPKRRTRDGEENGPWEDVTDEAGVDVQHMKLPPAVEIDS